MRALALVIGNSKYEDELITPENDANDLADKLKSFGFIVKKDIDVDLDKFNTLVDSFGTELNNFDIGLFYFAGHGMQIDGDNFLTATNTNFDTEVSAKYSSVTLYKVLAYMNKAKNETNIIILDACRNNPYEKKWSRNIKQNGLAPLHAPKGTLIAFSTSPGEIALNGSGRNGLYTHCLLTYLDEPKIQVEDLFKRVRNAVFAYSGGKQTTWEHTSLTAQFIFNSGAYIQASSTEYSNEEIADKLYVPSEDDVDNIIKDLKSRNWYIQNPAIRKVYDIDPTKVEKGKLFVLGRNILQAAQGTEKAAKAFLDNIENSARKFNVAGNNHLLNGILFEIYFDAEGRFRGDKLKTAFFDKILSLVIKDEYASSFRFIKEQLQPFSDSLLFIPAPNATPISLNLVLEKVEHDKIVEFKVKGIKLEGKELLKKEEDSWLFRNDGELAYEPYTFVRLKQSISKQLGVPDTFLNLSTNFTLDALSKLLYPFGYTLSKG